MSKRTESWEEVRTGDEDSGRIEGGRRKRKPPKEMRERERRHEGDAGRQQHWGRFSAPFEFGGLKGWNSGTAKIAKLESRVGNDSKQ